MRRVYYQAVAVSERDLAPMRRIDELHLEQPFWSSRGLLRMLLRDQSLASWINADAPLGRKHFATLMRRMGIEAQCPKPGTSRKGRGSRHKVFPYLLDGVNFDQIEANTLWAMGTSPRSRTDQKSGTRRSVCAKCTLFAQNEGVTSISQARQFPGGNAERTKVRGTS